MPAVQTLGNVLRLCLRRQKLPRLPLLLTYLSLLARQALGHGNPGAVRILGQTIHCGRLSDVIAVFEEIFIYRYYDINAGTQRPRIIEGGANIGLAVAYLKLIYPDARIDAFEAEPKTAALLASTIRANGWPDVTLHPFALWSEDALLRFGTFDEHAGSPVASVFDYVSGQQHTAYGEIPGKRLSPFVDSAVDLLILNIEGAECAVIGELAASGRLSRIRQMIIEIHQDNGSDKDLVPGLLEALTGGGFGYRLHVSGVPFTPDRFQNYMLYAYNVRDFPAEAGTRVLQPHNGR